MTLEKSRGTGSRRAKPQSRPRRSAKPKAAVKTVNLALQGGGAHGAFTWGVLDRLLDDERLDYEGITGTSAGAMNAVAFAQGLKDGGREGAKDCLAGMWRKVSDAAVFSPLAPSLFERFLPPGLRGLSPAHTFFDMASRLISPYQTNPLNINPLKDLLESHIDFEGLQSFCPIKLFIAATNVETGKVRVFERHEICSQHILASAALPHMFQAVEVDGEPYWDGGYMGNPSIFPLIYGCESADVILVHINPIERRGTPRTAPEILNRLNEITFNSSLMREMRAIAFVTRLIDEGKVKDGKLKRMLVHSIEAEEFMRTLRLETKLHPGRRLLERLHDVGYETADRWLETSFDAIGERSSVDVRAEFL